MLMLGNEVNSDDQEFMTTISKSELSDLRSQLEAAHEYHCIAEYTLCGKIISANENYLKLTGYNASDLSGQNIGILLDLKYRHSKDNVAFWEMLNIGKPISGKFKRIGKGFKTIWIQATYFPIMDFNGKPFKVVEYAADITEYVQLEQVLTKTVEQVHEVVMAVKNKDLTQRVPLEGKAGEMARLSNDVNSMVDCIEAIIVMINKTGDSLIAATNKVNAASKALSLRN